MTALLFVKAVMVVVANHSQGGYSSAFARLESQIM